MACVVIKYCSGVHTGIREQAGDLDELSMVMGGTELSIPIYEIYVGGWNNSTEVARQEASSASPG